tara:strand:- start:2922 stop:3242 length:321 start_codon:yes stop_codon:yes gene_type:complete
MENILQNGMNITHNEKYNAELIFKIIKKLVDKKNLYPEIIKKEHDNFEIKIKFYRPEWYTEYQDDLQVIVEENIKTTYVNLVNNFIKTELYNNNEYYHSSKRRRLN